jgi:CHASE3 domain sensor protein
MIQTQKIRKTILGMGVVLPVAGLLAAIWLTHETNGEFSAAFDSVTQAYKIQNALAETQSHISEAETGQRGYLLTDRKDYFESYDAAMGTVNNDLRELKNLLSDNPIQLINLIELKSLVAKRLALDPEKIAFSKTNSPDSLAIELTDEGRETKNEIRVVIFRMREQETDSLAASEKDAESRFLFDQTASLVLVGVTALALIAIITILIRLEKLRQIVTVCAWTGQVRHEGQWIRLDQYLKQRFGLSVSHGLSAEAAEKMKREIEEINRLKHPSEPVPPSEG